MQRIMATLRGSVLRHAVLAAAFSGGLSGRAYDTKFIENLVNEESVNEMASITEAQR